MKLTQLRLSNFQSFGPNGTVIRFEPTTFLIGPNGSGKTAVLQAMVRLFGTDPNLRRVRRSDFYVDSGEEKETISKLFIEADFEFPELKDAKNKHSTIPSNFAHMRLETKDGLPRIRLRLDAEIDVDGDIQEKLIYVLEIDGAGEPIKKADVPRNDRSAVQVHYLPALRDPSDHISFSTSALIGRVLQAATWSGQSKSIAQLTQQISAALRANDAVVGLNERIADAWGSLHKGSYFSKANVSFERSEIESLLRHLTIGFTPGHGEGSVDYSRLGDGQKSLLYLCLVLAVQELGRQVLSGTLKGWDALKLRPALFSLIAMEEPENSLSPHYLGRIIKSLSEFAGHHDAQAVVATHSPALLIRVAPEQIRYLRLDTGRRTIVKSIVMPPTETEAYKFVREAVQAFPELYFSRLVILFLQRRRLTACRSGMVATLS
jgi:putative ATP-dependent endonuclease of OLD family